MFDSYILNDKLETKPLTTDELIITINQYLKNIGVTWEILTAKNKYRLKHRVGNIAVAEIRRAICLFVKDNSKLFLIDIAKIAGLTDHASALHHIKKGRKFREMNDEKFMSYYLPLKDLI